MSHNLVIFFVYSIQRALYRQSFAPRYMGVAFCGEQGGVSQ